MKLFLLFATGLLACAQLERPRIGMMLDEGGSARAIFGVDASAIASEPVWKGVLSLVCSAHSCVAKTQAALVSSSGDVIEAPEGPAILAADGVGSYAYFPGTGRLLRWRGGWLETVDFTPEGEVLDLRATPDGLECAVRRGDGIWVGSRYLGDPVTVLLLDNGVVIASAGEIRLVRADGTETRFPVSGATAFLRMSDEYVQMKDSAGMWALRTTPGQEQVFLLPGGAQE